MYHGQEYNVDVDNLEDFVYIDSESMYYHQDDVAQCVHCGKWVVKANANCDERIDGYFCDDRCEDAYKVDHWHYAKYDDEYYPKAENITTACVWDVETQRYVPTTISLEMLNYLNKRNRTFSIGQIWFIPREALATAG